MPKSTSRPRRGRSTSKPNRSRSKADKSKRPYQHITLYDAVAGRISTRGPIPHQPQYSTTRDTATSSTTPLPPEEILFARRNAPERYEEDDFYWANKDLEEGQELPDSDLLKGVHEYVSDFYGTMFGLDEGLGGLGGKGTDFKSMNESALICLGVLLEEAAEEVLGETGDMVFVEGDEAQVVSESEEEQLGEASEDGRGLEDRETEESDEESSHTDDSESSDQGRARKRGRVGRERSVSESLV
ncbi:MAG: hypothetical protein Q9218_004935 [Villophora microphyllina]